MSEFFSQPDDLGDIKSSELHSSLGERLGAQFGEAFMGASRTLVRGREYAGAESGQETLGSQIQRLQNGEDLNDVVSKPQATAEVPIADAKARVKQEGLEGRFKLPEQPTIKQPVLDLMIDHAHERQQYDAAVSRGPQGFIPGALGMVTEIGAGIIDPVNIAAFSIPVLGEARAGMMIAGAGESLAARAGVKTGIGAVQGAVGSTALLPGDWWLHTKDGVDYTMADALHLVVMGAGMGGAFHAAIGAYGDLRARGRGAPLPGSAADLQLRALRGDIDAADLLERMKVRPADDGTGLTPGNGPTDALGRPPSAEGVSADEVPGISPAAEAPARGPAAEVLAPTEALPTGHPAEVLADLPPRAREDVLRASIADVVNGNAVRAGDLLQEAGKADPRIAESLDAGRDAALAHAQGLGPAGREVFEDMRGQLRRAGMDDAEAHANAAIVAARYEARAARLEGAGGTAADLYRAEGITVRRHTPAELLADELGRRYDQGKLDDAQLELFRDAARHLPTEPEEDAAAAFDRMHAAYYTPERLARMQTEFVAPGPPRTMMTAEPHIIEMMRNGASSAEINEALARSRAERDARRTKDARRWHASFGQDERGRITLAENKAIIDLFAHADSSTFVHESGHLWLDELMRDGMRPDAPAALRDDMHTVLTWLGADGPEGITTPMHEKWAQGFEQYLATGKAPSEELAGAFQQFKEWLTALYRSITALGEPIGPEIRAVMDRMMATPEQVKEHAAAERSRARALQGPKGPRARNPETWSLAEFIASRGGLDPTDPMIGDVRHSIGSGNKFVPGFGNLIRKDGMRLDQAREAAVEAGYLRDMGDITGGQSQTDVRTLLDAVDREMRGERVYRDGRDPTADDTVSEESRAFIEREAVGALRDDGIDTASIPAKTMARVIEMMDREGERDPLIAYERAIMEEGYNGETRPNQRISETIPGWDVPDDAAAASGAGRAADAGREAGAGQAARDAGAGDRAAPGGRRGAGDLAPDWQKLADARRAGDEDLAEASRAAERDPEPESISTDAAKVVSAAERAAAEADKLLEDILPTLSEEERAIFKEALDALEHDKTQREQIVREGTACLLAATA